MPTNLLTGRKDYNITDNAGKIPADEPVLVLRAQDRYATALARMYVSILASNGEQPSIIQSAIATADGIDAWCAANPDKVKHPDLPS